MPEKMIKEMIKTPGRYAFVVDNNFKIVSVEPINDMAGTYVVRLDNKLEIMSVTHKGQLMKNRSEDPNDPDYIDPKDKKFKPQHFEGVPNSDEVIVPVELKVGCVGFGAIVSDPTQKDPCRWLWGTWW